MTTIPVNLSGIVDGQQIDAIDVITPLNDLKTAAEQILDGGYDFLKTRLVDATPVIISSGVIAVSQTRHLVVNEGLLATDDLTTINGTDIDLVLIQLYDFASTLTVKHNTGNIWFAAERDYIIDDIAIVVVLRWNSDQAKWIGDVVNLGSIWLDAAESVTISSNTATIHQTKVKLLPQTGIVDDLENIVNSRDVDMLILSSANIGNTITVKHNIGNIFFFDGNDFILGNQNTVLVLVWNDVVSKWISITITNQAAFAYSDPIGNSGALTDLEIPAFLYEGTSPIQLHILPRISRRRMLLDEVITGTTFDTLGGTMTNVGTAAALNNGAGAWVVLTSTATINLAASRRSNAIFQWQWSPVAEFRLGLVDNQAVSAGPPSLNAQWIGFLGATLPVVVAGPNITYVGVTGIWMEQKFPTPGMWGKIYNNGTLVGSVQFAPSFNNFSSSGSTVCRIWIDGINNNVIFECNGERSTPVNIASPGALTTFALLLTAAVKANQAVGARITISSMYGEQY